MEQMSGQGREQVGELMQGFVKSVVDFYGDIKSRDVYREADEKTISRLRKTGIPRTGRPVGEVFEEMMGQVYENQSLVQHPRCFACIPSPVSLYSWMGDVMTNAFDPHAGSWINASGAGCIEQELIRWMGDLAGYPKTSSGLFVSGGSMANLTALTAARDAKLTEEDRTRAVAYVSDQTHSSVAKGLHIIGFRADQVRKIRTDRRFSMDVSALREAVLEDLGEGRKPFAVIATAGTTNTGSIDPLEDIASLCKAHGLWMHVDGAFGASILVSDRYRGLLKGIEQSDSISWDAHKWLMQTYGCSVVLMREEAHLIRSFCVHPEYLKDAKVKESQTNYWDLGPELTRPARALKLWITLQAMGSDGMAAVIEHGYEMAKLAEEILRADAQWEIVSPAQQAILNFRYAPKGMTKKQLDAINESIAWEVTASGFAEVLTTELGGNKVLRMCTLHPETTEEDIKKTLELLRKSAKGILGRVSA